MKKINYFFNVLILAFMATALGQAQTPDPNFHIYLAFGQSNMEGQNWSGTSIAYSDVLPVQYKQNVDPRFQVMTAVSGSYKLADGSYQQRTQGQWYTAVPPLVRNSLGLSPVDYFGRTLVAGIPNKNVKVGIIVVAVGGAAIEGFEKGNTANTYYKGQASYMQTYASYYDNNPYNRLVTLAKEAQKVGVIKGILMHQGESGAASGNWGQKVKGIYDNLLSDLGLPPNSIPILAGQVYGNNNANINGLPNVITGNLPGTTNKIANVISSQGCPTGGDNLHFSYEGYKTLGERYGQKMLELLYSTPESGFSLTVNTTPGGGNVTKTPDNTTYAANATVQLTAQPADGWKFDSWSGDATGANATITVTMDKAKNITANFVQQTGFTLSTTISPATGGSVTASPAGGRYEKGTAVTLTPVPSTGWKFDGWSGDATDSQNPLVITMDANKTITAKFSPTADGTTNLVKDGNFPGNGLTNNWSIGAYGNSAATASVSGGKATLNITAVGTQIYQPQLIQKGISLEQGMKYRLTFTASAAAEKEINVMLQQSSDPYASYTQDTMFALTTAPQTFTLEFEMTSPSDANTQLSFNVGGTTRSVTISDVNLVYIAAFTDPELTGVSDISAGTSQSNLRVSVLSNSAVDVSFRAIGSGKTELRLYNLKGDVVASAGLQTFAGKSYSHTFDQKLPGGLYILWMYHNGHVEQAKVMVPR